MFGDIIFLFFSQVYKMKCVIYITQSKYLKKILKTFGMKESRPLGKHVVTGHKLSKKGNFILGGSNII